MEHPIFLPASCCASGSRIGRDAKTQAGGHSPARRRLAREARSSRPGRRARRQSAPGTAIGRSQSEPPGEGGDHDGEESSQGRQEEGSEEAITLLHGHPKGAGRPPSIGSTPFPFRSNPPRKYGGARSGLGHTVPDADALDDIRGRQAIDDVHAGGHGAKDRVAGIEVRLR
jgi:hypothetical protein